MDFRNTTRSNEGARHCNNEDRESHNSRPQMELSNQTCYNIRTLQCSLDRNGAKTRQSLDN